MKLWKKRNYSEKHNSVNDSIGIELLLMVLELQRLWNNMTNKQKKMLFGQCTVITEIPNDMFKYNTNITNYSEIFKNCDKNENKN